MGRFRMPLTGLLMERFRMPLTGLLMGRSGCH